MLIITRKPNQGFYITEDIYVSILEVNRNQVRIGIKAPEAMSILREELIDNTNLPPIHVDEVDSLNQQKEYHRLQKQLQRMRICCLSA